MSKKRKFLIYVVYIRLEVINNMDFVQKYLQSKISLVVVIGILCLTNVFSVIYFLNNKTTKEECICEDCTKVETKEETIATSKIKVDIKGYVKKPGVYELDSGSIVNDLIKLAGGLKTNGTTDNINLSKTLNNEDMVVILSKTELKQQISNTNMTTTTSSTSNTSTSTSSNTTQSNNISSSSTTQETNKKISLNTATKEELMTLYGIGEAKALSIIEYREKTPFKDISEIMNISGIGESIYEKIKDYITI